MTGKSRLGWHLTNRAWAFQTLLALFEPPAGAPRENPRFKSAAGAVAAIPTLPPCLAVMLSSRESCPKGLGASDQLDKTFSPADGARREERRKTHESGDHFLNRCR
jgi:hypothetical protein